MEKVSSLANSTCPDLSYMALSMSKKNNSAMISNLRDVSRILKKVRERSSKLKLTKIGKWDDLMIVGFRVASFKAKENAKGGVLLSLTNQ